MLSSPFHSDFFVPRFGRHRKGGTSLLLLFALLCPVLGLHPLAQAQNPPADKSITFAQFTDIHIFDDGWKESRSDAYAMAIDDRASFHWAIDQVNALVSSGKKISFVVFTGDLGLQNVEFSQDPACRAPSPEIDKDGRSLQPFPLNSAVEELAGEISRLAVSKFLILPGNNDLVDEKVNDPRYKCFLTALRKHLALQALSLDVIDLGIDNPVDLAGVRFIGLNTASFKKQAAYEPACLPGGAPANAPYRRECPEAQMNRLANSLKGSPDTPFVLFTHVPNLLDPYWHTDSWGIGKPFEDLWEHEACSSAVLGIFAGHFHAADDSVYGTTTGTRKLNVRDCVTAKTWLAPPLAIKNQTKNKLQSDQNPSRGFLLVTLSKKGIDKVELNSYPSPLPAGKRPVNPVSSAFSRWRILVIVFLLLIAMMFLGLALWSRTWKEATKMLSPGKELSAMAAVLLSIVFSVFIAWFAKRLAITESAIIVALLLIPLLIYGIVSGRLTEFSGPGGWSAKFRDAARQPVEQKAMTIDPAASLTNDLEKDTIEQLRLKAGQIRMRDPIVMTLVLGKGATYYNTTAMTRALDLLLRFPHFRFVVFVDSDARFVSYIPAWILRAMMEHNYAEANALIQAVNSGVKADVIRASGMQTETVSSGTTYADALEKMERLDLEAIPILDPQTQRVSGVIERSRVVSRMLNALAKS